MDGVAEQGSGAVDPGGGSDPGDAVDHDDLPGGGGVGGVEVGVVAWAEHDQVV